MLAVWPAIKFIFFLYLYHPFVDMKAVILAGGLGTPVRRNTSSRSLWWKLAAGLSFGISSDL